MLNPYLFYNGNCEAAFKYYEKVLGGKIEIHAARRRRPCGHEARARLRKEDHACADGDRRQHPDGLRCASRTFSQAAGLCGVADRHGSSREAEKKFKALAEGGAENMPFGKTFFSKGFGMCVDQFGMPWMVNCPLEGM